MSCQFAVISRQKDKGERLKAEGKGKKVLH